MRALFDTTMRAHIHVLFLIFLALLLTSEFLSKPLAFFLSQMWVLTASLALTLAWLLQRPLYHYVGSDPNRLMIVAWTFCRNRIPHAADFPFWHNGFIPDQIKTHDENAKLYLTQICKAPFLPQITRTQFDRNPLRFSWLRARKDSISLDNLEPLDQILYHKNKSIIGAAIRFFTRSYWEHAAIHIGNGTILDTAPGGTKKVAIQKWIDNPDVDLAVIRYNIPDKQSRITKATSIEGSGYNYIGVAGELWRILAGNHDPYGLSIARVTIFLTIANGLPQLANSINLADRFQIVINTVITAFLSQATWHPLAYTNYQLLFPQTIKSTPNEEP